eukprot:5637731-Karenia_brevis.AAC.1
MAGPVIDGDRPERRPARTYGQIKLLKPLCLGEGPDFHEADMDLVDTDGSENEPAPEAFAAFFFDKL